jgi:hypothetical protein
MNKNNELRQMWHKVIVGYLKVLPQQYPGVYNTLNRLSYNKNSFEAYYIVIQL